MTDNNPTATVTLDVCTAKGKTWAARIVGTDPKFGLERDFIRAASKDTSRSGMTGTATYRLENGGIYETNEPRWGRRVYLVVADGTTRAVSQDEVLGMLRGDV